MLKSVVFLSLAALLLLLASCDQKPQAGASAPAPGAASSPAGVVKAPCLPCDGHEIVVRETTLKTEYNGQTYYFCTDDCRKSFTEHPEKYIKSIATTSPTTSPAH